MATVDYLQDPSRRTFLRNTGLTLSLPALIAAVELANQLDKNFFADYNAKTKQLVTHIGKVQFEQVQHIHSNPLALFDFDLKAYYAADNPDFDRKIWSQLQQLAPSAPYLFSETGVLAMGCVVEIAGQPVLASHRGVFDSLMEQNRFYAALPNFGIYTFNTNGYQVTHGGDSDIAYIPIENESLTAPLKERNTPRIPEIEQFSMHHVFTMHPAKNAYTELTLQPDGTYAITGGVGQNNEGPYNNVSQTTIGSPAFVSSSRGPQVVGMIMGMPINLEDPQGRTEEETGFGCTTHGIQISPFRAQYCTDTETVFI